MRMPAPSQQAHVSPASTKEVTEHREALQELIHSEGWAIFCAYARREWEGKGYKSRMAVALEQPDPLGPKVVHRASMEIVRLLQWPSDQVESLKGEVE
jgi:hypothetical protein